MQEVDSSLIVEFLAQEKVQTFLSDLDLNRAEKLLFAKPVFPPLENKYLYYQVKGRLKALSKLPNWGASHSLLYPEPISLEQCSSQETAIYKQVLFKSSDRVMDVTGGFGVDSYFISQVVFHLEYFEQNELLAEIVRYNFDQLKVRNVKPHCRNFADVMDSNVHSLGNAVFVDPARRHETKNKVYKIEDCTPNLAQWVPYWLERNIRVVAKLSPMLDIQALCRTFPKKIQEIHVVGVKNECKELIAVIDGTEVEDPLVFCANLKSDGEIHKFKLSEREKRARVIDNVKQYLYEPNASILKAEMGDSLAQSLGLEKLHEHTQLYTSDIYFNQYPGRIHRVQYKGKIDKQLADFFPQKKANIVCRNYPLKPDELRKKLGLGDGGTMFLYACTISGGKKMGIVANPIISSENL